MGIAMVTGRFDQPGNEFPPVVGWMMIVMGSAFIVGGWTLASLVFAAGRCLARRRRRMFCMVIAGIMCVFSPFGTILGVFTIVVLVRPSVRALFAADLPGAIPAPA